MKTDNRKFGLISILKLTIPSIIMMSFMSLYTMVDGAFVSRFVSTDALSATNIVFPFINFMIGISVMIASGGCALVMKKLGEGKEEEARKDFSLIITFALIISIAITILGIVFIDPIIRFLGSTDILYEYCKDYLFYMILFAVPTILKFIFEQFLIAINKAGLALTLSFFGGILNIILDYLFIGVLGFGIKGAAIATNLGYAIPALVGLIIFFSKKNVLYYEKPSKDFKVILKSCYNGCSEMISQVSNGIITFLFNLATLKLMGEDGVAAITVILYIQFLVSSVFIGYSMGIAPKISFYYGNEDKNMLKKIIGNSLKFIWGASILI
ncbi:MAG: polysaccharide biosynthesis C-terminal domain-containing protein, partial [Eubacteriales bacterium]|nr:polysaccharide biosynthesis C-terminal domain-containing protein [Eubacteriales bacterium]